jgi:hypothetical protein
VIDWWWSWLLTAIGVTGLWMAGSKKAVGWAVGVFAQALWIAYALSTEQYGFLASALCYAFVYGRNFARWWAEAKAGLLR